LQVGTLQDHSLCRKSAVWTILGEADNVVLSWKDGAEEEKTDGDESKRECREIKGAYGD
jgi:hypothetical protein